jgi:hypothetical protein
VNNFFSCDIYKEPTQFEHGSNVFFIDNDRGISAGTPYSDTLVIHRFFYQPQQIQNSQQT